MSLNEIRRTVSTLFKLFFEDLTHPGRFRMQAPDGGHR
jgi:hypothetical protein